MFLWMPTNPCINGGTNLSLLCSAWFYHWQCSLEERMGGCVDWFANWLVKLKTDSFGWQFILSASSSGSPLICCSLAILSYYHCLQVEWLDIYYTSTPSVALWWASHLWNLIQRQCQWLSAIDTICGLCCTGNPQLTLVMDPACLPCYLNPC